MPRADAVGGAGLDARAGDLARVVNRARALVELARWPNVLISCAGVVLGAWWAGADTRATTAVLGAAAAAAGLTAVANAFNDYRDRAIDVVAHPDRPLPSGRATPADALAVATAGGAIALVGSASVSAGMAVATAAIAGTMIVYSVHLKRRGLVGNATAALLASLPFVYGAWSAGAPRGAALLYALAVPLHFARELAKDLDDAAADGTASRRTLPNAIGPVATRVALVVVLAIFAAASLLAFSSRGSRGAPLFLTPALACCAAGATRAWRGRAGAPRLLKAAMLFAMAGAVAARLGRML